MAIPAHVAEFIRKFSPYAQAEEKRSGIPASITLAQAGLESGWKIPPGFNFFGIKSHGQSGGQNLTTTEYNPKTGKYETVVASFRAYSNAGESFKDHSDFLAKNTRYADVFKTSDPYKIADILGKSGYATDPSYSSKLKSIMDNYGLTQFDKGGGGKVSSGSSIVDWMKDMTNIIVGGSGGDHPTSGNPGQIGHETEGEGKGLGDRSIWNLLTGTGLSEIWEGIKTNTVTVLLLIVGVVLLVMTLYSMFLGGGNTVVVTKGGKSK